MSIRTIQCPSGEVCYAEQCVGAGACMHLDELVGAEPAREQAPECPKCERLISHTDSEPTVCFGCAAVLVNKNGAWLVAEYDDYVKFTPDQGKKVADMWARARGARQRKPVGGATAMKHILRLERTDGRFVIVRVGQIAAIENAVFVGAFHLHIQGIGHTFQITEKSAIAVIEALAAWESELNDEVEQIMEVSFPGYVRPAATHGAFPDDAECCKCGESYLQHQADEKRDKHVTKQRTCGKFSVVIVAPPKQAVTGG